MSATNREVAHRIFAAEYDEATHSYSESDEERAPNYVVTPTGARVNRLFLVGVLTEVEQVSDDVLRARVADPTGAFVVYAGQYQPDEMAFLERADPPTFVAVTGKANTFSPDGSERIYTSVRPESITEVDADTRDRWTVGAAEQTLARVATARAALDLDAEGDALEAALGESGVPVGLAAGIPRAFAAYGTTEHYLAAMADTAREALALVAGEADEVAPSSVAPGDAGDGTVDPAAIAAGVEAAVVDLVAPAAASTDAAGGSSDSAEGDEDAATAGESTEEADAATAATTDDDEAVETTDTGEAGGEDDDLGDFEPGGGAEGADAARDADAPEGPAPADDDAGSTVEEPDGDPAADADTGDGPDDVLGEDERERIEATYGTDFSTGTEVDEPGEADIEPEAGPIEPEGDAEQDPGDATSPVQDDAAAPDADAAGTPAAPTEEPADDGATVPAGDGDDTAPAEDEAGEDGETAGTDDVDLEAAVVAAMESLDDGDGADREAVVAAVVDDHGVDPGAAEDAIQDALMAGKCYEPEDGRVKAI